MYQKHVRPLEAVTDYRTFVSGIRAKDLRGPKAEDFWKVQKEVNEILKDRILVGHAVHNDLKVRLGSILDDMQRMRTICRPRTFATVLCAGFVAESPKEGHPRHGALQAIDGVRLNINIAKLYRVASHVFPTSLIHTYWNVGILQSIRACTVAKGHRERNIGANHSRGGTLTGEC